MKKTKTEIHRRKLGIQILTGKIVPCAYLVYEVTFSDGKTEVVYGRQIQTHVTFGMLNGTAKQKKDALKAHHPEMSATLHAAAILIREIEAACLKLDDVDIR